MKLSKLSKLATVSAFALILAASPNNANAVLYDNGEAIPMTITVEVVNSFDAVITQMNWGTISVRSDQDVGEEATATLSTAGVFTPDAGVPGEAAIINSDATGRTQATIALTLLPETTLITVTYSNLVNVTDSASAFDTAILDNLDGPAVGTLGTAGGITLGGVNTPGTATTDGTGQLTFAIGGSLRTQTGVADVYDPGTYTGSFDMTITY